jgi:Domain of unknown function (DUF5615)
MLRLLLDENVTPSLRTQILGRDASICVWIVGDPDAPSKGTLDPEILIWCEERKFILVTNNRRSMPGHLLDHLTLGRHIPGILILSDRISFGETVEELILIAEGSFEEEYRDRIQFLPLL